FAAVAEFFHLLAYVVIDDVIVDGFSLLLGLDDGGAFVPFVEGTHGAFGSTIDSDFFVIGEGRGGIEGERQHSETGEGCEYFFHNFSIINFSGVIAWLICLQSGKCQAVKPSSHDHDHTSSRKHLHLLLDAPKPNWLPAC